MLPKINAGLVGLVMRSPNLVLLLPIPQLKFQFSMIIFLSGILGEEIFRFL